MNKQQIKDDLIAHLREGVLAEQAEANAEGAAALVDERDLSGEHRVDDVSQEEEAGDLTGLAEQAEAAESDEVEAAKALDVSATDTVRPGAVIEMDGAHFVVGVPSSAFTSGGVEYTGLSTDAPIYAELEGKKAADTFSFNDIEHTITSVA